MTINVKGVCRRAGHYGNRIWVITAGCLVWGVMTLGFSASRSLRAATCFWAINGLGLSLVIPNVQVSAGGCSSTAPVLLCAEGESCGSLHELHQAVWLAPAVLCLC